MGTFRKKTLNLKGVLYIINEMNEVIAIDVIVSYTNEENWNWVELFQVNENML